MCDEARAAGRQWARQLKPSTAGRASSVLASALVTSPVSVALRSVAGGRREADEAQHGVRQVGFRGANVHRSESRAPRAMKGATGWRRTGRR